MEINTIHNFDSLSGLSLLPEESIDCCVTSPPYYGLRDYGKDGQIGLEDTPEEYIRKLVSVFSDVKRTLKKEGNLWVNIGDSYAGSGQPKLSQGIKPKDLIGIPWMLAFALRADGWYWRQTIIWSKTNGMPESIKDRCSNSHEYILLFSKSDKYYFDSDAIKQPAKESTLKRLSQNIEAQGESLRTQKQNGPMKAVIGGKKRRNIGSDDPMYRSKTSREYEYSLFANKRSVWEIPVASFKEAHFAVFPEKLIVDCIKAGCPVDGVVLDPFMGSGTTAIVSRKLGRNFVGFELNEKYVRLANRRIKKELGLFA